MTPSLERVRGALVPADSLGALADLRREPGIVVTFDGPRAWVRWEGSAEPVVRRLLPEPGVVLFENREGLWFRLGERLPAFGVPFGPGDGAMPLSRSVLPRPVDPIAPGGDPIEPARLGLVRDDRPRAATALVCSLENLGHWAEMAPSAWFLGLSAARSGHSILVRGRELPVLPGQRLWGERVLTPLGFRPEPELDEGALRAAVGVPDDALLVLGPERCEAISRAAFRPLTRASVRLAREEGSA